jgi:exodeoxyribonuclease VIII
MLLGTATHSLILEPHKLPFIRKPAGLDRRTKAGKEEYDALLVAAGGLPIFDQDDADRLERIRDAVYAHTAANNLLNAVKHVEMAITWRDYAANVPCKALLDGYFDGCVIDLKTTQDASPAGFMRAIAKYQYHLQVAQYLNGARFYRPGLVDFLFIAVETAAPFAVGVYRLSTEAISFGQDMMERAADIYSRCLFSNEWPAYKQGIEELELPGYVFRDAETL